MKLKRSDIYIIYNLGYGKKAHRTKGYIFQKKGHWFTIRHNELKLDGSDKRKWVISDLVTGLIMTKTDSKLDDVPDALSDSFIDTLIKLYKDDSTSIYKKESNREEFQRYAQMINEAMFKDNQMKLIDYLQDSAYELFN